MKEETKQWNSIKLTTLATYAVIAALGAWGGMEYQSLKIAAQTSTMQDLQQAGFAPQKASLPVFIDSGVY